MRLIIHIGMGKTGTSSIQECLRLNVSMLGRQGVEYLGLWFNVISQAFVGHAGFDKFLKQDREQKQESAEIFYQKLKEIYEQRGIETFILSNEGIVCAGPQINPFLEKLVALGVDVSFIVYVRDPRSWLPSAYTQWGLSHKYNTGPIQPFRQRAKELIHHYNCLKFWIDNYNDVTVFRKFSTDIDVIADFAAAIGYDLPPIERRELERAEPADIVLRAFFNDSFDGAVLPEHFDRIVIDSSRRKIKSLERIYELCFNFEGGDEIINENIEIFELIHEKVGLNLIEGAHIQKEKAHFQQVENRILDYLVELVFDQAKRIKRLERGMKDLNIKDPK